MRAYLQQLRQELSARLIEQIYKGSDEPSKVRGVCGVDLGDRLLGDRILGDRILGDSLFESET